MTVDQPYPRVGRSKARERILRAATHLFYVRGIHATGVDRVAEEAGATKMTLYSHFKSKEALVVDVLETRLAELQAWFESAVCPPGRKPAEAIDALFDLLREMQAGGEYHGCPFTRVLTEITEPANPARLVAAQQKVWLEAQLSRLAAESGAEAPAEAGRMMMLLLEGAALMVLIHGDSAYEAQARAAALRQLGPDA